MPDVEESVHAADWPLTSLGALIDAGEAELQTGPFGTMLHASAYSTSGVPVVAVKHIGDNQLSHDGLPRINGLDADRLGRYRLQEGDILFARKGSVDRRALVKADEADWIQGSDCIRLRLRRSAMHPRFASYVFGTSAHRDWILQHAHGATMPSLNQEILRLIPLPIPPLAEQHRIAEILGALDDKIELNRHMNHMLESIARTIFKSWFVDFDPVRKTMEGKTGGELGPSPELWPVVPFSETVEILSGGTPSTSQASYWGGSIAWYSVADAPSQGDVFVTQTEKSVTSEGIDNSAAQVVPELTTIISARGTVGRCALTGRDMAFNQSCFGLRPADHVGYYFTYFSTLRIVDELRQSAHGSVFSTITRPTFASVKVPQPPGDLVAAFEARVRPLMRRTWLNVDESRTLQMTRDSLLPRLIGGGFPEGVA